MKAQVCPVCNGRGIVAKGFYELGFEEHEDVTPNETITEECRSCKGKGYIFVGGEYIPSVTYPIDSGTNPSDWSVTGDWFMVG